MRGGPLDQCLVDGARDRFVAQHHDHPLDLPPPAEMDDVAGIAALAGEARRLGRGVIAESLDEVRRIRQGGAVGKMVVVAQDRLSLFL